MSARYAQVLASFVFVLAGCDRGSAEAEWIAPTSSSSSSSSSSTSSSSSGNMETPNDDSLSVSEHFPYAGADNVALVSTVRLTFNQPLLDHSFKQDLIQLQTDDNFVEGEIRRVNDRTFEFIPKRPLLPSSDYNVTVGYAMAASGAEHLTSTFSFSTVANIGSTSQAVIDQCMNARDIAMLAAINEARAVARSCGSNEMPAVPSLSWNCQLAQAAQGHSEDMAGVDFFSHTGSDGSSSADRLSRTGYRWSSVRENIAAGQRTVEQVVSGFLGSEGHCINIMANEVSHFGSAYSENQNSSYGRYWTQVFAAPRR